MPDEKKPWTPLKRWMDATDPQRDVTLAAFAGVVAFGVALLTTDWWHTKSISATWVQAFAILAGMVALGGPARAAVDKWRNKDATNAAPSAGAPDQDGGNQ